MGKIISVLILIFFAGEASLCGQNKTAASLLSSAIYEEEVSGNLDKAIELYLDILRRYPDERPLAAKALYHLGLATEKRGISKADEYYNRLINGYPDQTEWVSLARKKLQKSKTNDFFTDSRDGHKYRFVKIGNQTWMAENLAYIPHVNPKMKQENGIWVYDYDGWNIDAAKETRNYQTYGCLYDWPTAIGLDSTWLDSVRTGNYQNRQGICPPGWHLPTDEEWKELEKSLGMPDKPLNDIKFSRSGKHSQWSQLPEYPPVGRYLKADEGWSGNGNGDNRSGFCALPGGSRRVASTPLYFSGIANYACFWSASVAFVDSIRYADEPHDLVAWSREMPGINEDVCRMFSPFSFGQSVRCVKNPTGQNSNETNENLSNLKKTTLPNPSSTLSNTANSPSPNWSRIGGNARNSGFVSGPAPQNRPHIAWTTSRYLVHDLFIVAEDRVFLPSFDSIIYAFSTVTGNELWSVKTSSAIVSSLQLTDRYPLLIAETYDSTTTRFNILFINYETGKILWESGPGNSYHSTLYTDGVFIYAEGNRTLIALDVETREKLWEKPFPNSVQSYFVASRDLIVTTGANLDTWGNLDESKPYFIRALDIKSGMQKWCFNSLMPSYSIPSVSGTSLYIGCNDQYLYSINVSTGKKEWRFFTSGQIWDSPAVAYGRVYFSSTDDFLYALDGSTGRQIWKTSFPTRSGTLAHPAIADSLVVVCGRDSCLHAFDAMSGKILWKYGMNFPISYNPIIYKGRIYYVFAGTLYVLEQVN